MKLKITFRKHYLHREGFIMFTAEHDGRSIGIGTDTSMQFTPLRLMSDLYKEKNTYILTFEEILEWISK